jgi:hypothetical protein
MRRYLITAPRWSLSVFYGVFFGFWMVLFDTVMLGFGFGHLIGGVLGGVVFGVVMGRQADDYRRRMRAELGPLTDDEFRHVAHATLRGPVPADAEVRRSAAQLVRLRLAEFDSQRWQSLSVIAVITVGCVVAAVVDSRWWAAFALVCVAICGYLLLLPTRLSRRLQLLETSAGPTDR